jgi:hypothetical protein
MDTHNSWFQTQQKKWTTGGKHINFSIKASFKMHNREILNYELFSIKLPQKTGKIYKFKIKNNFWEKAYNKKYMQLEKFLIKNNNI